MKNSGRTFAVKRGLCLIIALFSFLLFTGCSASVNYLTFSDSENYYEQLEIGVDVTAVATIESNAAFHTVDGESVRWTLSDYLYALAQIVSKDFGWQFKNVREQVSGDYIYYQYLRTVPKNSGDYAPALPDLSSQNAESKARGIKIKDMFFVYELTVTGQNPFNGLKNEFDAAADISGAQSETFMEILRVGSGSIGEGGVYYEDFPSVFKAFPRLSVADAENLQLNYLMLGSENMKSTGSKIRVGENTFYLWNRRFDDKTDSYTYVYYRANSIGWNVVAIAAAGLTVGMIILIVKLKNKKPPASPKDKFPYDPGGGDSDIYGNLPSSYKDK